MPFVPGTFSAPHAVPGGLPRRPEGQEFGGSAELARAQRHLSSNARGCSRLSLVGIRWHGRCPNPRDPGMARRTIIQVLAASGNSGGPRWLE
jgi:hypothetical protein